MSYDDPRARGGFERNDSRSRIAPINDDGPRGPPHRDDPRHQDPRHATRQEYPREEPRGLGGANQYDEAPPIKSYSALANPPNRNEWMVVTRYDTLYTSWTQARAIQNLEVDSLIPHLWIIYAFELCGLL